MFIFIDFESGFFLMESFGEWGVNIGVFLNLKKNIRLGVKFLGVLLNFYMGLGLKKIIIFLCVDIFIYKIRGGVRIIVCGFFFGEFWL